MQVHLLQCRQCAVDATEPRLVEELCTADNLMAVQNAAIGKGRGGKKRGYDPHNDDESHESHGIGGGESHNRSGKSENKSGKGGGKRHGMTKEAALPQTQLN